MADFRIRAYGRMELAQAYSPNVCADTAWRRLSAWIDGNPALRATLRAANYNGTTRVFTPEQVRIIVQYIGEP